jgi:hypothetical protein
VDAPGGHWQPCGVPVSDCVHDDHLLELDGVISPQPWMQWRQVASVSAPSKNGTYGVTLTSGGGVDIFGTLLSLFGSLFNSIPLLFGPGSPLFGLAETASAAGNKNDLLHSLELTWVNNSPVTQHVYGKITRGGARVSLQPRSRGGLVLRSGYKVGAVIDPDPLTDSSMFGIGADLGRAGTLAIGTTFGVAEQRMNSVTIPLAPERAGWAVLIPGARITAKVELRFISEFWENTTIDGGDSGSESSYETGGTRLDLFAVPLIT